MNTDHLYLSDVVVRAGGRHILRVDELRIGKGEFVGVIGTNGAGKTTLVRLCCGLIRPNRGIVRFHGKVLNRFCGWQKNNICRNIGYIPQAAEYNSDLPFTLREVVMMGRTGVKPLLARLNQRDRQHADYWLENLGLTDRADQTFRSLSGGEQQKALIARAMAAEPELLVLDEPGSNLDFNWKKQLAGILDRLYRQRQVTILMVSHETSLLPRSCARVLLLHQGGVIADGPTEQVLNSTALEDAYDCRVKVVDIDGQWYAVSQEDKDERNEN